MSINIMPTCILVVSLAVNVIIAVLLDKKRGTPAGLDDENTLNGMVYDNGLAKADAYLESSQRFCATCLEELKGEVAVCPSCHTATDVSNERHQLPVGMVIDNRYYIGKAIDESDDVITYAARDTVLRIKVSFNEYYPKSCVLHRSETYEVIANAKSADAESFNSGKKSFLHDMMFQSSLSRATSAVCVRDMFSANGTVCSVTDNVMGKTLSEYFLTAAPFSVEHAISLFLPVLRTLAAEHSMGNIRKNISPENIILCDDRLILKGTASRSGNPITSKETAFVAEEINRSQGEIGPWTDVYSVSAVLYYCITGTAPDEVSQRIYNDYADPAKPSSLNIPITDEFEKILLKGLGIHKEKRWQSCDEMLEKICSAHKSTGQKNGKFIRPVVDEPLDNEPGSPGYTGSDEPTDNDL